MRVYLGNDLSAKSFAETLLKEGNGFYPTDKGKVVIPSSLGIVVTSLDDLSSMIYPDISNNLRKPLDWLSDCAILAPTNNKVTHFNNNLLKLFDGEEVLFKSIDSVLQSDDAVQFPVEFLNSLEPPGLP